MSYNKFKKLEMLRTQFGINEIQTTWMPTNLPVFAKSPILLQSLQDAKEEALATEKAKSEYVIVPVLKELRRNNPHTFSSFSGYEFNVDVKSGLNGFCDFILSAEPQKASLTAPIICLVEAKKGEIETGWGQCGAEMYAAQIFNEREGNPRKVIYGCVTNAFSWCFMKLENKQLFIEQNYIPLTFTAPYEVLAALQWILDKSLANE